MGERLDGNAQLPTDGKIAVLAAGEAGDAETRVHGAIYRITQFCGLLVVSTDLPCDNALRE